MCVCVCVCGLSQVSAFLPSLRLSGQSYVYLFCPLIRLFAPLSPPSLFFRALTSLTPTVSSFLFQPIQTVCMPRPLVYPHACFEMRRVGGLRAVTPTCPDLHQSGCRPTSLAPPTMCCIELHCIEQKQAHGAMAANSAAQIKSRKLQTYFRLGLLSSW